MNINIFIFTLLIGFISPSLMAQTVNGEFGTLFTTPSERKIIDSNRYKKKKKKPQTVEVAKVEVEKPKEILYRTIEKEYKISGVSIANNGEDSAWINGELHENGDVINKKIKVSVYSKKQQVRFTVKGGKTFYGKSGDTVKVTYKEQIFE